MLSMTCLDLDFLKLLCVGNFLNQICLAADCCTPKNRFMNGDSMSLKSPQTCLFLGRATYDDTRKPPCAEGMDGSPVDLGISIGSGVTTFDIHVTTTALNKDQATTETRNLLHNGAHNIAEGKHSYICRLS